MNPIIWWFLTTRDGFQLLSLQVIGTVAVHAYLAAIGALRPEYLWPPLVLAPMVAWTLRQNWRLRNRYCQHCGRQAVECWPLCQDSTVTDSGDDGGLR